ncbi:MAG TPA: hypothetical protein PLN89_08345 [Elusimicrobiota bacterium]|nr:hypothetical protein [Elusimicrobiota bacterium]
MNRETGGRGAAPSMALSQLFGLSGLLWFLQFALLRWVGFEVPLLAYHPHLMYLGFLFGLGAGCWRPATRRARAPLGPSIFLAVAAFLRWAALHWDIRTPAPMDLMEIIRRRRRERRALRASSGD